MTVKLYIVRFTEFSIVGEPASLDAVFFDRNKADEYLAKNYDSRQIVKRWAWVDKWTTEDDIKFEDHFKVVKKHD